MKRRGEGRRTNNTKRAKHIQVLDLFVPPDIWASILGFLSNKILLRFGRVCKEWNKIVWKIVSHLNFSRAEDSSLFFIITAIKRCSNLKGLQLPYWVDDSLVHSLSDSLTYLDLQGI